MTVCRASAGTGKTYTLAAYYVALLMAGESYRSILAVTFTNKATIEMKERILTYLYGIASQPDLVDIRDFMNKVREMAMVLKKHGVNNRVGELSDDEMSKMAEKLFRAILADYDNMRVSTIDSFLQVLLTGMARSLCKAAGFNVELDSDKEVSDAIEQLLSTHIHTQQGLEQTIYAYIQERMEQDDKWDIRDGLLSLAKELTKESVQCRAINPNPNAIQDYLNVVAEQQETNPTDYDLTVAHLRDLMLLDYIRRQMDINLSERNSVLLADTAKILDGALREGDADFILEQVGIRYHHIMLDEFQDTSTLQWRNFEHLIGSILSDGGTVFIVGDVKQSIYRFRNGDWSIMANLSASNPKYGAYYNSMNLSCNFRSEKYVVQFNQRLFAILQPKINEINTCLGNYYNEQYTDASLPLFYLTREKDKKNHIGHEHGFVQVSAYPYYSTKIKNLKPEQEPYQNQAVRQRIVADMFERINMLLQHGDRPKDMMILVYGNKEAKYIVSEFERIKHQKDNLKNATITARNSYQLDGSLSVMLIVSALRYRFLNDDVARAYLVHVIGPDRVAMLETLDLHIPLFELVQRMLSICVLTNNQPDDVAYINAFMDALRNFIGSSGSDAKAFLQFWDDKMHSQSVPVAETNSIQIMTIHTSKGLEAKNVFLPFCNWTIIKDVNYIWTEQQLLDTNDPRAIGLVPIIPQKAKMDESAYLEAYEQEHLAQRADQLNLLYVALTRAAERLYVSVPVQYMAKGFDFSDEYKNIGQYLTSHLTLSDKGQDIPMITAIANEWDQPKNNMRVDYTLGEEFWTKEKKTDTSKADKPFSFEDVKDQDKLLCQLHPENTAIQFCQSQESMQYALYGIEKGEERIRRKEFGTLCHDIMAHVAKQSDVPFVLLDYRDRAIIEDDSMFQEIKKLIDKAWTNPMMCDWFSGRYSLLREEAMLALVEGQVEEKRMDRVMIDPITNSATVLDYKFGYHDKDDYHKQVLLYMQLLRQMGYSSVRGYLWFAHRAELKEVVE